MGVLDWLGMKPEPKKDPVPVSDDTFKDEVQRSDLPVLLDAWGPNCQPCKALVPTIQRLTAKYEGRIKVVELNVARNPRTAGKLGIRGTPTVVFFKKGRIVEQVVGMRGQHYYEDIIENSLLGGPARAE